MSDLRMQLIEIEGYFISVLTNIIMALAVAILLAVISCLGYKCYR